MKELLIKIRALFEGRGVADAESGVRKVADASEKASGGVGKLGDAFGGAEVKAGIFAGVAASLTAMLLDLPGKLAGLVQGFAAGIKGAADWAGALTDVGARTGQTVAETAVLQQAFNNAGLGAAKVGPALNLMQKALAGINEAGEPTAEVFSQIGLNIEELRRLNGVQQLDAIGQAILRIKDPAAQAAASMKIFGRSGGELLALFKDGQSFAKAREQIGQLALILEQSAPALDAFSDSVGASGVKNLQFFGGAAKELALQLQQLGGALDALDLTASGMALGKAINDLLGPLEQLVVVMKAVSVESGVSARAIGHLVESISGGLITKVDLLKGSFAGFLGVLNAAKQVPGGLLPGTFFENLTKANLELAALEQKAKTTGAGVATQGAAAVQSAGQTAAQGVQEAGAAAAAKVELTAEQLKAATAQVAAAFANANAQGVGPALAALQQGVLEGFARLVGEITTAAGAIQQAQAEQSARLADAVRELGVEAAQNDQLLSQGLASAKAALNAVEARLQAQIAALASRG
jgi:hypothetical protein